MKNITVSVDEEVYRSARIRAAERGTSVSALVADYLTSISQDKAEFNRLGNQQKQIVSEIERFSAGERLNRDEIHSRAVH